jgi:hypothetical protein
MLPTTSFVEFKMGLLKKEFIFSFGIKFNSSIIPAIAISDALCVPSEIFKAIADFK